MIECQGFFLRVTGREKETFCLNNVSESSQEEIWWQRVTCISVHSTVREIDWQGISSGNQLNNAKGWPVGENASSVCCHDQKENRLVEMIRKGMKNYRQWTVMLYKSI